MKLLTPRWTFGIHEGFSHCCTANISEAMYKRRNKPAPEPGLTLECPVCGVQAVLDEEGFFTKP